MAVVARRSAGRRCHPWDVLAQGVLTWDVLSWDVLTWDILSGCESVIFVTT
jgi:hypothetical protein